VGTGPPPNPPTPHPPTPNPQIMIKNNIYLYFLNYLKKILIIKSLI